MLLKMILYTCYNLDGQHIDSPEGESFCIKRIHDRLDNS